ncbi:MAG: VanZ family protein [Crocinitomicaceae bacterium]|nr:VanZ family protein [Crocinitomicaceae bacterium]
MNKTPEIRKTLLIISWIGVFLGITFLSLLPPKSAVPVGEYDKISHLFAYMCLALNSFLLINSKNHFVGVVVLICYGILIELLQAYIPGRFPSFWDGIANSIGVVIGWGMIFYAKKFNLYKTPCS